jgi:hypothetical protein
MASCAFYTKAGSVIKAHKTGNIFRIAPTYFAIKATAIGIIRKWRLFKGIVLFPNCNC